MSAFPDAEITARPVPGVRLSGAQFAAISAAVAVLGVFTIAPSLLILWTMWTTEALKSIGMVVPIVSFVLILRAWKGIGWRAEGSWWGLALLFAAVVGSWVEGRGNLVLLLTPGETRMFPPASLVFLAYGCGTVLLIGGRRLLRAALFPVLLLLLVNPIPHAFTQWIDLPLQRASAEVARGLAMHMGQKLTPDRLRLMFTPDFGMFIAPGCNGIRGSATMGLIALVTGYLYRFRWSATAAVTAGAVLLGYVFNLVRLCLLVFYYLIALHLPRLQNEAEQADYAIGAGLFLIATLVLFAVIHRLRDSQDSALVEDVVIEQPASGAGRPRGQWMRLIGLGALAVFGISGMTRAMADARASSPSAVSAVPPFPPRLGGYVRQRMWNETLTEGAIVYLWAEYVPEGGGTPISIGISPVANWHNPLICHSVRGQDPIWQGQLTAATGDGPVQFSSGFYNDGVTQFLESSTLCAGGSCGEYATQRRHMGFVLSFPGLRSAMGAESGHSVRVLLRVETLDGTEPADAARSQLTSTLQGFLASVRLYDLTQPYQSPSN